jgi:hypothetical protein
MIQVAEPFSGRHAEAFPLHLLLQRLPERFCRQVRQEMIRLGEIQFIF